MIDLSFDCHDFVACVEGFAHGSHLRQHVWREIVFRNIPQMTEDEMDFFWYIFRRNLWNCYFNEQRNVYMSNACGHEDYLHVLAALHRGNRYKVTFLPDNLKHIITVECYRFAGHYRPLREPGQEARMASFDAFVPEEWIKDVVKLDMPDNTMVQQGREEWWTDLSVYDDKKYCE